MNSVLYFTSSYEIGLTALLTEQACALMEQAPQEFIFVSGEKEQQPGLFTKLKSAGARCEIILGLDDHTGFYSHARRLEALWAKYKPSVIHVQTNWQLGLAIVVKHLFRHEFAVFYTVHGYRHNYKMRSIVARYLIGTALFLFSDRVFVTSTFLKRVFKFIGPKVAVLYLGVDDDFYEADTSLPDSSTRHLIFPGEFRAGKNQEMIIHALHAYISRTGDRSVRLFLPGKGEKVGACINLAIQLGIRENVIFPGFVNRAQLLTLYHSCHCAIIPTNIETFGLSIAEPYVLGRVILARRVGIAGDILIDGYNGYLFEDEQELTELLCTLLPNTKLLAHTAKRTAMNRDLFRWSRIARQYLEDVSRYWHEGSQPIASSVPVHFHVMIIWSKFLPYHRARMRHLRRRLQELGHRLTAVEVSSKDDIYPTEILSDAGEDEQITCFQATPYKSLQARTIYRRIYGLLRVVKPDIVFAPATPFPSGMASTKYRLQYHNRLVMMDDAWDYSDRRGFFVRWIKNRIHQNIDAAFVPAPTHAKYYQSLGFPENRVLYGVDVVDNVFYSLHAEKAQKKRAGLLSTYKLPERYFLFVGRFIPLKGISILLQAYRLYRTTAKTDVWSLVFVGDGKEKHHIVQEMSQTPGIYLGGARSGEELAHFYGLAKAFIMPSSVETWGLVVNEAMASGLPVIVSTGCGSTRTLVSENINGWSFEVNNVQDLAQKMTRCSECSENELKSMGIASQQIISEWSLDLFADSVLSALSIPRREEADLIANILTRFWMGRTNVYP